MNKEQRLDAIRELVDKRGTIRVTDIVDILKVSDMTIRRDLSELEEKGILTRIHGGARSNNAFLFKEKSHEDKHFINVTEKRYIAQKAVDLIEEGDTIFLGPGTTVELLAEEINNKSLRVITNCLPVYEILHEKRSETFKVSLIGGEMRDVTRSFVGEITNMILEKMHFSKMFFSANAVRGNDVMTSTFEEAYTQKIVIGRSLEKYLLMDGSKFRKEDFTSFSSLTDVTAIVTDIHDDDIINKLSKYTEVIN